MLLLKHLPPLFGDVYEYQQLDSTEGTELYALDTLLDTDYNDLFAVSASSTGMTRFERQFGMVNHAGETLDERRDRVLVKLAKPQTPYTENVLRKMLSDLCGGVDEFSMTVDYANYKIVLRIALSSKAAFDEASDLLKRILPANMVTDIDLIYNTYGDLEGKTHVYLSNFTHKDLRGGIIFDG